MYALTRFNNIYILNITPVEMVDSSISEYIQSHSYLRGGTMQNYHSQNGFFHYKTCLKQPEKNITQI
jgi:hypothetical protein